MILSKNYVMLFSYWGIVQLQTVVVFVLLLLDYSNLFSVFIGMFFADDVVSAEASKGSTGTPGAAPAKAAKVASKKSDSASVAASEKKGGDRPIEKERKKDVPHPRMQYDDTSRVEKAKRRAVVKQTEARNRVELFRHLPQYERGSQLPDLEFKFFQLEAMHPAVYRVHISSPDK